MALLHLETRPGGRKIRIKPARMGYNPGLNCDSIESLIEYGEGAQHR